MGVLWDFPSIYLLFSTITFWKKQNKTKKKKKKKKLVHWANYIEF